MKNKFKNMSDTNILLAITIIIFVLMYLAAILIIGGSFKKPQAFLDILNNNSGLIITSVGLSIVMIVGSIDISVGGVTALVTMCCAMYLDFGGGNVAVSILMAVAIGLAFGIIQGYLIAYLEIQPFIITLAGMFFARGMTTIVNESPHNVENPLFMALKDAKVIIPGLGYTNKKGLYVDAKVELGVVVAVLIVVIMFIVLRWTKFGRNLYAVGGNPQSALMLGINVKRTRFFAHVLSGLFAGIGGYCYFLHVGSGAPAHASGMEMNAIASSIIGGTMLTGGVGNMFGTFVGVVSLNTIKNIVVSIGLQDAWWTGITVAAMLCLFLVIQSIVMAFKKKAVK
ncbi:MAG: sugar ABC transporter permease YjfF [Lachnospiraceae bacterium]|nr:sugar ABC transporter permease YjfF [Lachnospiraceae bacterium]